MKLFTQNDGMLYELQETFNRLPAENRLTMNHFELAQVTEYSEDEWREFLTNGKVAKEIERDYELFKQTQMRKLVSLATTNDKSMGTAQMLNAIGKTLEDSSVEQHFFIYSHVPVNEEESYAPTVREETQWRAGEAQVVEETVEDVVATVAEPAKVEVEVPKEMKIDEADW